MKRKNKIKMPSGKELASILKDIKADPEQKYISERPISPPYCFGDAKWSLNTPNQ